ncbi:MAG: minichromosome maintenance protein MCM, partial [Thermotogaceae bacterium]|nr:minichromosome maintenance protein MCM [Thermotogaceae bacterium]
MNEQSKAMPNGISQEDLIEALHGKIPEAEIKILVKLFERVKEEGPIEWDQLTRQEQFTLASYLDQPKTITLDTFAKVLQSVQGRMPNSESWNPPKVPPVPRLELKKEEVPERFHKMELMEPWNFGLELWNQEILDELKKLLQQRYDLGRPSDAEIILLFLEHDNAQMTKSVIQQLLKQRGIPAGTIRRMFSGTLNKADQGKSPIFISIKSMTDTYYQIDPDVYNEIKEFVKNFLKDKQVKIAEEQKHGEARDELVEKFIGFFRNFTDDSGKKVYLERITDLLTLKKSKRFFPEQIIKGAEEALQVILKEDFFKKEDLKFNVRFCNLPKTIKVKDIGSEHISKFIQVEGIVSRQVEHKPFVSKAVFRCVVCGHEMVRLQKPYTEMVAPQKCEKCGSKNIELEIKLSTFLNAQFFKIQDLPDAMFGTNARSIECVVLDDLVDTFLPGDRVKVTGILRIVLEKKGGLPVFRKILEVNHIEVVTKRISDIELSQQEIQEIQELAKREDIVDLITRSIAPSIYGHEDVKKGLALALFSGGNWIAPDGTVTRGHSHVLLLGDPGVAKSTITRFLKQVIPRGIVTTAKTSSAAGLTASAVRDEFTGSWVLEAGALVLANGGICVIDEFDKMSDKDRAAIHEALEQGTISVSKAGINVTLSAKATVIAIGNPKGGSYNPMKKISEQITFPPTLLSRFDLIFVVLDQPDEEMDKAIAEHILRYKVGGDRRQEPEFIPPELLKKYIAYARQHCDPKFTEEAIEFLTEYYVKM